MLCDCDVMLELTLVLLTDSDEGWVDERLLPMPEVLDTWSTPTVLPDVVTGKPGMAKSPDSATVEWATGLSFS